MIHEYALEPSLLSSWAANDRDYEEFFREYGLGTPRIFSSFPRKKASKLRSYFLQKCPADSQSLQAMRYTEMVTKLVESLVLREVSELKADSWDQLAKLEDERRPFGVVLSTAAIDTKRSVTPADMYARGSIWNHPSQLSIQRTNEGLSLAVLGLARLATQQVTVIDAYGWNERAIGFMRHLVGCITQNRVNSQIPSVALLYKHNQNSPDTTYIKQEILQGIDVEDINLQLEVLALEEINQNDVFHNRCILTEHGGVIIGHGIDVSGKKEHSDEATLMTTDIYQKKWTQFMKDGCFQIVSRA